MATVLHRLSTEHETNAQWAGNIESIEHTFSSSNEEIMGLLFNGPYNSATDGFSALLFKEESDATKELSRQWQIVAPQDAVRSVG